MFIVFGPFKVYVLWIVNMDLRFRAFIVNLARKSGLVVLLVNICVGLDRKSWYSCITGNHTLQVVGSR